MSKARYERELNRLEPRVRRAFLEWVRSRAQLTRVQDVERLIDSGEFHLLLRTMGVTDASLSDVAEAVRETYAGAGSFEAPMVQITFNIRNEQAERWLRQNSSRLVTNIINSQREAIQEVLEFGAQQGNNPRRTALDIVGRVSRQTGRREGGVVGLSGPQARYIVNAKAELASGDPEAMGRYLTRQRRDRRFDSMVVRAMRENRRLSYADIDKITGRYSDRLLQLRGETIARTETINAFNAAREQAWEQAIEDGVIERGSVVSIWSATMDARTRDIHRAMNQQKRQAGQPFESPTGARLMYPGDTSLGAGGEDTINCRCHLVKRADFIGEAARRSRRASSG